MVEKIKHQDKDRGSQHTLRVSRIEAAGAFRYTIKKTMHRSQSLVAISRSMDTAQNCRQIVTMKI